MEILGIIGIFIAIIAIIWMSVKGMHIAVAAPLATLIVILTSRMNIFDFMVGKEHSYMTGLAGFLINNFAIFLLGAVLAQYIEKSNATLSIANFVLKLVGRDNPFYVMLAFALIAAILTYGGVSLYVVMFALIPLAKPIFKELDVSWKLLPIPLFLGMATVTMSMLPGAPSVQNAVPTSVIGTTLTAAPLLSLIGAAAALAYGVLYLYLQLKASKAKGEGFYSYSAGEAERQADELTSKQEVQIDETKLPSILLSVLPLVTLIIIIMLFSKVDHIILIALTVAIVMSSIIFRPYIKEQMPLLNAGANGSIGSAFATSSSVAFGSVLTASPAFAIIQHAITSIPGSPLIGLSVAAALLSAVTGSASGSLGIVMNSIAGDYIANGLNPELVHRIAVVAAAVTTSMPHSGVNITYNNLAGTTIKDGFIHQVFIVGGCHLVALIVMILVSNILY